MYENHMKGRTHFTFVWRHLLPLLKRISNIFVWCYEFIKVFRRREQKPPLKWHNWLEDDDSNPRYRISIMNEDEKVEKVLLWYESDSEYDEVKVE